MDILPGYLPKTMTHDGREIGEVRSGGALFRGALTLSSTFFPMIRIGSEGALTVLRGSEVFEALLVDLQRPDLRLQCGAWHTEPESRAEGSIHPPSAFTQRSLNDCFLLRRELLE